MVPLWGEMVHTSLPKAAKLEKPALLQSDVILTQHVLDSSSTSAQLVPMFHYAKPGKRP